VVSMVPVAAPVSSSQVYHGEAKSPPSEIREARKKKCIPVGAGLVFDVANIGAHRSRQIHAHYSVDYL